MEGGVSSTDAGEAAGMLNALKALGLDGQRLTVSLGSEESLARQLADWMGLPRRASKGTACKLCTGTCQGCSYDGGPGVTCCWGWSIELCARDA